MKKQNKNEPPQGDARGGIPGHPGTPGTNPLRGPKSGAKSPILPYEKEEIGLSSSKATPRESANDASLLGAKTGTTQSGQGAHLGMDKDQGVSKPKEGGSAYVPENEQESTTKKSNKKNK